MVNDSYKELEVLVLTGLSGGRFIRPSDAGLNFRDEGSDIGAVRRLSGRGLVDYLIVKETAVDIDEDHINECTTRLTPQSIILYGQILQLYGDSVKKSQK